MRDIPRMQIQGMPLGGGAAAGRIKTMRGWEAPQLEQGTVLVAFFASPKLSGALTNASALVCAYGSCNSYLAQQARARGIPAVFQIGDAIHRLTEYARVHVDGTAGIVSDLAA